MGTTDIGQSFAKIVDRADDCRFASGTTKFASQFWATLGHPRPHTRALVENLEGSYDPLRTRRIQNGVATQSDLIFLDHQLPYGELSGIVGGFGVGRRQLGYLGHVVSGFRLGLRGRQHAFDDLGELASSIREWL